MIVMLLAALFATPAMAGIEDNLPVKAPQNAFVKLAETDSPTTMVFSFNIDPVMSKFLSIIDAKRANETLAEALAPYGATDIDVQVQIDWALDDENDPVSGWHYNEYWDDKYDKGLGIDEDGHARFSEWDVVNWGLNSWTETVQDYWIMRGVPDDSRWNGVPEENTPGVKDQLNENQYTYSDDTVHIDFAEHTAYFRVRFVITLETENEDGRVYKHYFTDWSNTCGYGKDVTKLNPVTAEELLAPKVADLHLTQETEHGQPVVGFNLTVPEEINVAAAKAGARGGGIWLDTEARVEGDAEWTAIDTDMFGITTNEVKGYLFYLLKEGETIVDGTKVEIRCRYRCFQSGEDDVFSPWSETLKFETTEIKDDPKPTPTETPVEPEPTQAPAVEEKEEDDECSLCGFCPQPLGLCIFIWLAIIIVIVVIVVIFVKKLGKKEEKQQS